MSLNEADELLFLSLSEYVYGEGEVPGMSDSFRARQAAYIQMRYDVNLQVQDYRPATNYQVVQTENQANHLDLQPGQSANEHSNGHHNLASEISNHAVGGSADGISNLKPKQPTSPYFSIEDLRAHVHISPIPQGHIAFARRHQLPSLEDWESVLINYVRSSAKTRDFDKLLISCNRIQAIIEQKLGETGPGFVSKVPGNWPQGNLATWKNQVKSGYNYDPERCNGYMFRDTHYRNVRVLKGKKFLTPFEDSYKLIMAAHLNKNDPGKHLSRDDTFKALQEVTSSIKKAELMYRFIELCPHEGCKNRTKVGTEQKEKGERKAAASKRAVEKAGKINSLPVDGIEQDLNSNESPSRKKQKHNTEFPNTPPEETRDVFALAEQEVERPLYRNHRVEAPHAQHRIISRHAATHFPTPSISPRQSFNSIPSRRLSMQPPPSSLSNMSYRIATLEADLFGDKQNAEFDSHLEGLPSGDFDPSFTIGLVAEGAQASYLPARVPVRFHANSFGRAENMNFGTEMGGYHLEHSTNEITDQIALKGQQQLLCNENDCMFWFSRRIKKGVWI